MSKNNIKQVLPVKHFVKKFYEASELLDSEKELSHQKLSKIIIKGSESNKSTDTNIVT